MSGIIGHLTYAILGRQAILEKAPQIAQLIDEHLDSYLAGAYFGADIMTLPGGRCIVCDPLDNDLGGFHHSRIPHRILCIDHQATSLCQLQNRPQLDNYPSARQSIGRFEALFLE
jgi:hypothetical protein